MILNLIMNAIDSMRSVEPRALSVRSKLNGHDSVQVSIEDTGVGIDPANLSQIFKPLFTTKDHGMGMGFPSAIRSSTATKVGFGQRLAARVAPFSILNCRQKPFDTLAYEWAL